MVSDVVERKAYTNSMPYLVVCYVGLLRYKLLSFSQGYFL